MDKEIKIKWLKEKSNHKSGDIVKVSKEMAEHLVKKGDAELITKVEDRTKITKEETKNNENLIKKIKSKEKNEPELNYEQIQSIKLELQGKLPELSKALKEEGRKKQSDKIITEILDEEENITEEERETIEKEQLNKKEEIQKEYVEKKKKKENILYSLKMNVVSLLAQKKRREATEEIVEYIESKEFIYTIKDDIKSEVWIYQNGVYQPNGKSHIAEECRKILEEHFTTHLMNEIISKIEADTYIESEDFFKNDYIEEIPVQNGILNIKTKKLYPFNPKKIFFNKLPVKYNPKATCPNIEKHLDMLRTYRNFIFATSFLSFRPCHKSPRQNCILHQGNRLS